ncbi:hypothetical protein HW450_11105 [Corynebacterium hindlerae]|uniref:Uncharacterized protein n=1 Tax=Corynebacterium hindlerae TaxID=699041 RepID=A0A7G5FE31_9CORY|nr:hypothetical protein [Corynebacterium hindlerae]QMV84872.1 hypothetical protein HW450_11105 [Corynebacterium hindlerae]
MKILDTFVFIFAHLILGAILLVVLLTNENPQMGIYFLLLIPLSFASFVLVPFAVLRSIALFNTGQTFMQIGYILLVAISMVGGGMYLSDPDSVLAPAVFTVPASLVPIAVCGWITIFKSLSQKKPVVVP